MNRYRLPAAVTALLAAALWVVVPGAPAAAHTELKSTAPAAKSTVTRPVTEVTLTFTGLVRKPGTTVAVTGPDKTSYSSGDAEVLDRTITQKVDPLAVGVITVAWRTAAADGHAMQGSFTFTNRAAPSTPSAEPSPSPSAEPALTATPPATTPAAASPASDEDTSSSVVWWIAGAAVLLIAGTGGLLWRRRKTGTN